MPASEVAFSPSPDRDILWKMQLKQPAPPKLVPFLPEWRSVQPLCTTTQKGKAGKIKRTKKLPENVLNIVSYGIKRNVGNANNQFFSQFYHLNMLIATGLKD